jgi:hypothetical protein
MEEVHTFQPQFLFPSHFLLNLVFFFLRLLCVVFLLIIVLLISDRTLLFSYI